MSDNLYDFKEITPIGSANKESSKLFELSPRSSVGDYEASEELKDALQYASSEKVKALFEEVLESYGSGGDAPLGHTAEYINNELGGDGPYCPLE